ncbi:hypothetical protein, partial [Xanthomonas populi]|uniref:hypothetical protein n=1 Tax=Xanthomonas populi TaxID=53414 RepID=UPI001ABF012F
GAITHTARTRLQPDGHGLKNVGIPQIQAFFLRDQLLRHVSGYAGLLGLLRLAQSSVSNAWRF